MTAVGVYFQELRLAQNLTLKAVAEGLGVSDRIVSAWEKGEHAPKIDVMPRLLAKLHGAWEDITQLMQEDADDEAARTLARRRLTYQGLTEEQLAYLEALSPEQRQAVIEVARQILQR